MKIQPKHILKSIALGFPDLDEIRNRFNNQRSKGVLAAMPEFWRTSQHFVDPDRPPILVDLLHHNAEYLLRALVGAKFVQRITGAPLIGILGAPGVLDSPMGRHFSRAENVRMANAFGIED